MKFELRLDPRLRQALKWAGWPLLYLFCLLVFVRMTFPYRTLKERLVSEFNARSAERLLEIKDLGGVGIFGIEAEGVRMIPRAATQGGVASLAVDRAKVSAGPLSALFGNVAVDFDLEVGGGTIEGSFHQNDEKAEVRVDGKDVDISGVSVFSDLIGLPLAGVLFGEVELLLPEGKMSVAEGKFSLKIEDLTVGDGKAKVRNTIALPKIRAGDLNLAANVVAGRMEIEDLSANGPDFELNAGGKVRLREPFDKSIVDLDARFLFKEPYTTQSDITKSIFGSPDGKVPGLFDMDPNVRRAKDDQGRYGWRVSGLLAHPSFRPGAKPATNK